MLYNQRLNSITLNSNFNSDKSRLWQPFNKIINSVVAELAIVLLPPRTWYEPEEEDNTFGVTRYPCMPSLVALQQMRNRLHLANLGRKLMKWTAMATGSELRHIAARIEKIYQSFSEDMRNAYIILARCRYFYPNLNKMVIEGCPKVADISLLSSTKTSAAVKIVKYDVIENNTHPYAHLGLEKGGQTILDTKKAWLELLKRIIMMVELRTNFNLVENMYKTANKKWNVLLKLVIPRITLSTRYILSELDEIEREDSFRLKRFKQLKNRKKQKDLIRMEAAQNENRTVIPEVSLDLEIKGVNEKDEVDKNFCYCQDLSTEEKKDLDVDKYSEDRFEDIMLHADEIINLSNQNDVCDAKVLAINDELKLILDKLLEDRVCVHCKKDNQIKDAKKAHGSHHSDKNIASSSGLGSEISIPESMLGVKSEDNENLGHYKRKYKESIEVLRLQNEDGTIREKKKKVIVQTNTRNPIKAKELNDVAQQNLPCSCFKFDSESENSSREFDDAQRKSCRESNLLHTEDEDIKNIHCNTKSEPTCCSSHPYKGNLRYCMSLDDINNTGKPNTVTYPPRTNFDQNLLLERTSDMAEALDFSYMFKNIVNTMIKQNWSYMAYKRCYSEWPNFIYIFSKVKKANDDKGLIKDDSNIIDKLLKESYSYTNYPSICHCYKRSEIESIIRNACFHVNNFQYLFSRCVNADRVTHITKPDTENYYYSGDINVTLTIQSGNSDKLENINLNQLPLAPSININFFCVPKNILQEPMDNCIDQNRIIHNKLYKYFQRIASQLEMSKEKETTGTSALNIVPVSSKENTLCKINQALNDVNAKIQAMAVCSSKDICSLNYTLNHTNQMPINNDEQITTSTPPLAYIFSKISDANDNTEESSKIILYNNNAKFSYIFNSYKKIKIETLLKNACSNVVSFPYLFTNVLSKKESFKGNLKLADIKLMFDDISELQISNRLDKINNISEYESIDQKCITCVEYKSEDKKSNEGLKEENKNNEIIECSCGNSCNTKCNFNHTFGEGHLSYIFSKVKSCRSFNEFNSSKQMNIIENECLNKHIDSKKSENPPNIPFTNSKGDHTNIQNKSNLQYVTENQEVRRYVTTSYAYIFSKLSMSKTFTNPPNDFDIGVLFKDIFVWTENDYPYIFNKLENVGFTQNLNFYDYVRYKVINQYFKDCCKRKPEIRSDLKYILEKAGKEGHFVYIFSKVKKPTNTINTKRPNNDNIDRNILKCDSRNNSPTAFTYMFDKVQMGPRSMNALNDIETDVMFKESFKSMNDFPYSLSKNERSNLRAKIAKLYKDSCRSNNGLKNKYKYIFNKVCKLKNKQAENLQYYSKYTKKSIQRVTLSCSSFNDFGTKSVSFTSSQGILLKFPKNKTGSISYGIELLLKTGCACEKRVSIKYRSSTHKSTCSCDFDIQKMIDNLIDQSIVKSNAVHKQENVTKTVTNAKSNKDLENISLISRMLDTAKNDYVPTGTSKTSCKTDKCLSKADNLNSILSNSAASSYSWKSCVMKTCKAEAENVEKTISYSSFSFESSLDYMSYKSEDISFDNKENSNAIGYSAPNKDPTSLDINMPGSSIYNWDSLLSTREENIGKDIFMSKPNKSYNYLCLSNVHAKETSEIPYGNVLDLLDRSNHYSSLKQECSGFKPASCYSHNDLINKSKRQAHQPNTEYYCDICNQRNKESTDENSNAVTPCSSNVSVNKYELKD